MIKMSTSWFKDLGAIRISSTLIAEDTPPKQDGHYWSVSWQLEMHRENIVWKKNLVMLTVSSAISNIQTHFMPGDYW